jgi:RNA polymerase sigma factor (TIGR02999 family)
MHDVTDLLLLWRRGDAAALDRLVPLVYDELRRVARRHLRGESPGHAIQATALVHEVYLRLVDVDRMTLTSRAHFFGVAATLMRQILVDYARRQRADKRGGGVTVLSLDKAAPAAWTSNVDVLALDEALDALSAIDSRQCRVVELRFFAGLKIDEAAEALGVSPATVEREWALAPPDSTYLSRAAVRQLRVSDARRASDALRTSFPSSSISTLNLKWYRYGDLRKVGRCHSRGLPRDPAGATLRALELSAIHNAGTAICLSGLRSS